MAGTRKTVLSALVSACMIALSSHPAAAVESITWMLSDFPPISIAEGSHKDKGVSDQIARMVARSLPEIHHQFQRANLKRMLAELEAGQKICVPGLIKSEERERIMHFSRVPMLLLTPLALITRKQDRALFGASDTVSLEEVIRNPSLRLGLPDGISYGPQIDAIINRHKEDKHLYFDRGSSLMRGLLFMLASGRIDYRIAYPWMVEYLSEELEMPGQFVALKLRESSSPIIWHVACSKNEWGLSRIKEIDEVLVRLRPTPEYRGIAETWMPKESLPEYRQLYDELILSVK